MSLPEVLVGLADGVKAVEGGWEFQIHVQPGAKTTEVAGMHGDRVKVRLAAPPVDGKANKAVLAALTAALELRRGQIDIVQGDTSRTKLIEVPASSETEATLDRLRRG